MFIFHVVDCGVRRTTRVVGGNITDVFEFPWVVSMSRQGRYHCGGSLITKNHVLTAAHCFDKAKKSNTRTIRAGSSELNNNYTEIAIKKIYIPNEYYYYLSQMKFYDIDLLEVITTG